MSEPTYPLFAAGEWHEANTGDDATERQVRLSCAVPIRWLEAEAAPASPAMGHYLDRRGNAVTTLAPGEKLWIYGEGGLSFHVTIKVA